MTIISGHSTNASKIYIWDFIPTLEGKLSENIREAKVGIKSCRFISIYVVLTYVAIIVTNY